VALFFRLAFADRQIQPPAERKKNFPSSIFRLAVPEKKILSLPPIMNQLMYSAKTNPAYSPFLSGRTDEKTLSNTLTFSPINSGGGGKSLFISNLKETAGTFSQHCDFFPKPSGRFRNAAIPSRNRRDAFATLRFLPGAVGTFSQRCDSFPEPSGRFRNAAIPSRSRQDVFATLRFLPGTVGTFSQRCDSFPEPSGRFRNTAIPSRDRQDVFASLRFLPGTVRTFSQACDSFPKFFLYYPIISPVKIIRL
jgi:hypothetical protein